MSGFYISPELTIISTNTKGQSLTFLWTNILAKHFLTDVEQGFVYNLF